MAGAALVAVGAGLAIYIAICVADIRHNMAMDELKSRSQAHRKILSTYSHCMSGKSPGHLACLGAGQKERRWKASTLLCVKSVLVEAELVPGTVATP